MGMQNFEFTRKIAGKVNLLICGMSNDSLLEMET